jgi:hypothetical protein
MVSAALNLFLPDKALAMIVPLFQLEVTNCDLKF